MAKRDGRLFIARLPPAQVMPGPVGTASYRLAHPAHEVLQAGQDAKHDDEQQ